MRMVDGEVGDDGAWCARSGATGLRCGSGKPAGRATSFGVNDNPRVELDKIDRQLLRMLQADGRLTNADLAQRIGLSASACLRRLQRLEQSGVIAGYAALIDGEAIGRPTTVFIEVTLTGQGSAVLDAFERAVAACPDVLECHLMSGDFDYLLRVAVADMRDYERVHRQQVAAFPHVARVRTAFAMRAVVPMRGYAI
jgi:Lrp/AsnC family transcriptional regulator, leucine-responsive regulatory protein